MEQADNGASPTARATSLRPQPPAAFSQSGIPDADTLAQVARNIRHYLDRVELRQNGSGWNTTKTSGYTAAIVPEWALRQWLHAIQPGSYHE